MAFFRAAVTMKLPVAIQAHLASTQLTDLKELAHIADRLKLCHGPQLVHGGHTGGGDTVRR